VSGTFLTFPLCLLSAEGSEKQRLELLICHAMERAGTGSDIPDSRVMESEVVGFDRNNERHKQIVRGAIVINVSLRNVQSNVHGCCEARRFIEEMQRKHGPDPLVFISSELFWGCRDREEPTYREFSTLCAVNSVIGFKKYPVLVRRKMIIARQLGFKSSAVMKSELRTLPKRQRPEPLTTRQLRDTLDRLESRDLLVRCQASPRNVYFSTPSLLGVDELRDYVKKIAESKARVRLRRDIDRATFTKDQTPTTTGPQQGHLKRKSPEEQEKGPLKNEGPQPDHNGAATTSTTGAITGSTLINAFQETPLSKSALINGDSPAGGVHRLIAKEETEPEFKPPATSDEVIEFLSSLKTKASTWDPADCGNLWFNLYGADEAWTEKPWKEQAARWVHNARRMRFDGLEC
jgi:hypothetical protein